MTSSVPSTSAGRENYEYRDEFGNLEANLHFVETTRSFAPGLTILEIGCGKGTLLLRLREWGARIVGCEVSDFMLTESRRLHGPLPIAQSDGVNFPYPDDCFDVVLSFDVLEHIPDTDRHLVEVKRVLKPGGCYLLQDTQQVDEHDLRDAQMAEFHGMATRPLFTAQLAPAQAETSPTRVYRNVL